MGSMAALRLFGRIERPDGRAQHLSVDSELVVRGSTARPLRR
jgi:DNA-binding LacI/PurR family transcriptional regulator